MALTQRNDFVSYPPYLFLSPGTDCQRQPTLFPQNTNIETRERQEANCLISPLCSLKDFFSLLNFLFFLFLQVLPLDFNQKKQIGGGGKKKWGNRWGRGVSYLTATWPSLHLDLFTLGRWGCEWWWRGRGGVWRGVRGDEFPVTVILM